MNVNEKLVVITGGSGFLGLEFMKAITNAGGIAVNLDVIPSKIGTDIYADVSDEFSVLAAKRTIYKKFSKYPDALINCAAINPKVEEGECFTELEKLSIKQWDKELNVGLKGAMICSRIFGVEMARQGSGVILNISSDLGLIAPDQRIYGEKSKPVTYSVIKHGLIGLTRYLATYWADKGVRVNAVCFGGVYNNQPKSFVKKLTNLIPMGRMARKGEYNDLILFLISDSSSYMTGSIVAADGGRTCW